MLVAVAASIGAMVAACAGFFVGWGFGRAIGLPRYELFNDPAGVDDFTTALVGLVAGWLFGAWLGCRLASRRRSRPGWRAQMVALACMAVAVAVIGAGFVGSATADWYYPTVFFGGPPVAMATVAAVSNSARAAFPSD